MDISATERINRLEYMAERNSARACKRLAFYYYYGIYTEENIEKALYYSEKACRLAPNNLKCKQLHGRIYTYAHWDDFCETQTGSQEEMEWLLRFAEHYSGDAALILATSYTYGIYGERNFALANEWLNKASLLGNAKAKRRLALRYRYGIKIAENKDVYGKLCNDASIALYEDADYYAALYCYEDMAKNMVTLGMNNIGYHYYVGGGVAKNIANSLMWYLTSAEVGDSFARNFLATGSKTPRYYFAPWEIFKYLDAGKDTETTLRTTGFVNAGLKMLDVMTKEREMRRSRDDKTNGNEIVKAYEELANTGYPDALCAFAAVLPQGFMKMQVLKRAAMLGHSYALFELGNCYQKYNKEIAERCYREAASRGHKLAAVYLGEDI